MSRKSAAIALVALMTLPFSGADAAGNARDPVIGLLALPALFGEEPCEKTEAKPLPIYDWAEGAVPVGEIREDIPWSFDANGCGGRRIGLHGKGAWNGTELPTREFGYETPGPVVLARQGHRYRIMLDEAGGAGWIEPGKTARYYPLEDLLSEGLAYLDAAIWSGRICDRPGDAASCRKIGPFDDPRPTVSVFGHRRIGGALWFDVEVPARWQDGCGDVPRGAVRNRGWVAAHEKGHGMPAIWFYSRGC